MIKIKKLSYNKKIRLFNILCILLILGSCKGNSLNMNKHSNIKNFSLDSLDEKQQSNKPKVYRNISPNCSYSSYNNTSIFININDKNNQFYIQANPCDKIIDIKNKYIKQTKFPFEAKDVILLYNNKIYNDFDELPFDNKERLNFISCFTYLDILNNIKNYIISYSGIIKVKINRIHKIYSKLKKLLNDLLLKFINIINEIQFESNKNNFIKNAENLNFINEFNFGLEQVFKNINIILNQTNDPNIIKILLQTNTHIINDLETIIYNLKNYNKPKIFQNLIKKQKFQLNNNFLSSTEIRSQTLKQSLKDFQNCFSKENKKLIKNDIRIFFKEIKTKSALELNIAKYIVLGSYMDDYYKNKSKFFLKDYNKIKNLDFQINQMINQINY